jgi:membrane-bound lytic murein transglycosylase B
MPAIYTCDVCGKRPANEDDNGIILCALHRAKADLKELTAEYSALEEWINKCHMSRLTKMSVDIKELEDKIKKEEAAKAKLEQNLSQIQGAVYSTQSVINKTQGVIQETTQTISRKEQEIQNLNDQLELKKAMLRGFLQEIYYVRSQPVLNVVLEKRDFSEVFSNAEHLMTLEDKIVSVSHEIVDTKAQVEQDKIQLAEVKQKHEEILDQKVDEKQELLSDKAEVAADVAEKEATIEELQEKLAELQSDLSAITGKAFNAKDIKEAVEYASKKTGVPKGVLYGFLKMETNLGANTGQCTYAQVEKVAVARYKKYGSKYKASIALLYKRQNLFYDLVDDLDYSKNKKVSCSPSGYIGQGGAMGVPQFMSDTWQGYKASIVANTGHATPDPWNLTDGVMAMALKLKKAGATSDSASVIKKASINYLGTFYSNYYNGIVYWAKNYKKLFD